MSLLSSVNTSSPLCRIQSTPSPSSSNSSPSSFFHSPRLDNLAIRRRSEPTVDNDTERRESSGSMTSWDSLDEGVFKPPDDLSRDHLAASVSLSTTSSHSPHEVGTPEGDHVEQFSKFAFPLDNVSPTSSVTSTAPSKGEATPRAEIPQPVWPLSASSPIRGWNQNESGGMDIDDTDTPTSVRQPPALRNDNWRRKHGSLEMLQTPNMAALFTRDPASYHTHKPQPVQSAFPPQLTRQESSPTTLKRQSGESVRTTGSQQRVVAESTATGCFISAPLSPPAHYPGSARLSGRRDSASHLPELSEAPSSSSSSTKSSSSSLYNGLAPARNAPRWAHPPKVTNKISGRAWSFSQGQERPDVDFDPELFEGAEPESILEVMKGMDGRIAVKTTPADYIILAWLPGVKIDDITISMKGDRTVQIVADLWDEEDHAQWNVVLGEDVNKSNIGATFKGAELRVTVKRKQPQQTRSIRSGFSSWSAPAKVSAKGASSPDLQPTPAYPTTARAGP